MTGTDQKLVLAEIEVFSNKFMFIIKDAPKKQNLAAQVDEMLTYTFADGQKEICKPFITTSFIGENNPDPTFYS